MRDLRLTFAVANYILDPASTTEANCKLVRLEQPRRFATAPTAESQGMQIMSTKITSGCFGFFATASLIKGMSRNCGFSSGVPGIASTPARCLDPQFHFARRPLTQAGLRRSCRSDRWQTSGWCPNSAFTIFFPKHIPQRKLFRIIICGTRGLTMRSLRKTVSPEATLAETLQPSVPTADLCSSTSLGNPLLLRGLIPIMRTLHADFEPSAVALSSVVQSPKRVGFVVSLTTNSTFEKW